MAETPTKKQKPDEAGVEEQTSSYTLKLYQDRLKALRQGQEYLQNGDAPKAVECYSKYLSTLAGFFNVKKDELRPELFDQKKDLGELLLISNVYWDLAKIYDQNPRLKHLTVKSLEKFVIFTKDHKYQYANARMMKNYLKRGKAHHTRSFKHAYEKIKSESRGCFVSTYCFGAEHSVTLQLQLLKRDALRSSWGGFGVDLYYRFSPGIVDFFEGFPRIRGVFLPFVKVTLVMVAKGHRCIHSILR